MDVHVKFINGTPCTDMGTATGSLGCVKMTRIFSTLPAVQIVCDMSYLFIFVRHHRKLMPLVLVLGSFSNSIKGFLNDRESNAHTIDLPVASSLLSLALKYSQSL